MRRWTYNQYRMFFMAVGAANVLTKLAHPAVICQNIIPLDLWSSDPKSQHIFFQT